MATSVGATSVACRHEGSTAETRMRLENGRRSGVNAFELKFASASFQRAEAKLRHDRERDDHVTATDERSVLHRFRMITRWMQERAYHHGVKRHGTQSQDRASESWRPCHSSMVRPSITSSSASGRPTAFSNACRPPSSAPRHCPSRMPPNAAKPRRRPSEVPTEDRSEERRVGKECA